MKMTKEPDRLLRITEVLKLVPVSPRTWERGVAEGIYPASVPIGRRAVAWRESDIRRLIAEGIPTGPQQ